MKNCPLFFLLVPVFSLPFFNGEAQSQERVPAPLPRLVRLVDPAIGTGGHGHTYPGASMPFGMVQLSPDTRVDGWDACSAYHFSDSLIYGFSHTHLSGTGCSDYGDILVMPVTGNVSLNEYDFASPFKKSDEFADPGYYRVFLERYNIQAELTATLRAGMHRYTYPAAENAGIIVDLKHRDKVLDSYLKIVSNTEIEGMRVSQAWAQKQIVYFVLKFSHPFKTFSLATGYKSLSNTKEFSGTDIRALFSFSTEQNEIIRVKVGLSGVSCEGARKNLEAEIPGFDFDYAKQQASDAWNRELNKIAINSSNQVGKVVFYTALYHALLNPNLYMDVDGKYRGRDLDVHQAAGFDYYTVFSLWDTYRATHPLFTLIEQKKTSDFINTFIHQYEEGGMLPVWELSGNETGCMIGYHAVPVIADAYLKGIRGFDAAKAFEAMKHSANQDHLGLKYYKSKGYIPGDKEGESVSKTLEYAYDDWCIAQMAKAMGKTADYNNFIRRAQSYKNLFDPSTGFMRAKMNETWFSPFDPAEVNFNYTEANAWQYSFYVPQDISGLIALYGGKDKFAEKLDKLFAASSATTGREQADISGLIGQYAHGNEPSHHMAYLYDYAGQPWKTQKLVHTICTDLYSNRPEGLCGNEDCGQMSSWFVFSALGFYPVTPGSTTYAIGTPFFPEATIRLENGKTFTIRAKSADNENYYIQYATLNGSVYNKCYITQETIMQGGVLEFTMGADPLTTWGNAEGNYPSTTIRDQLITPVPTVSRGERTFADSTVVTVTSPVPGAKIYYTLDGSEPTVNSPQFLSPRTLKSNTTLKAFSLLPGMPKSVTISARFSRMPEHRKITLNTRYAPQYSGGGEMALIDLLRGGENFRTGAWQGYEGEDVDAVIDLGNEEDLHKLSAGFLQDADSWIFMPLEVTFSVSSDNRNFREVALVKNTVPEKAEGVQVKDFSAGVQGTRARYIHVVARNRKICPAWHAGSGSKAWIFADEITVE